MPFFPTEQWLAEYGRLLDETDALDDLADDVETVHLFDAAARSTGDRVVDRAVSHPAFLQKTAHRRVSRSLDIF